jgi:hypothetical protein
MTYLLKMLLAVGIAAISACTATPGVHFDRSSRITRVAPVVALNLVGTDQYRLRNGPGQPMNIDQLQKYFEVLFGTDNSRFGGHHRAIVLYSSRGAAPDTPPSSHAIELQQIAPIVAAARKYQCGVCIVYPEEPGIEIVASYYEAFPSQRR